MGDLLQALLYLGLIEGTLPHLSELGFPIEDMAPPSIAIEEGASSSSASEDDKMKVNILEPDSTNENIRQYPSRSFSLQYHMTTISH